MYFQIFWQRHHLIWCQCVQVQLDWSWCQAYQCIDVTIHHWNDLFSQTTVQWSQQQPHTMVCWLCCFQELSHTFARDLDILTMITVEIFNMSSDVQMIVSGLNSHMGSFVAMISQYRVKNLIRGIAISLVHAIFHCAKWSSLVRTWHTTVQPYQLGYFAAFTASSVAMCCCDCIHLSSTGLFSAMSDNGNLRKHLRRSGSLLISRSLEVKSKSTTGAFSPPL